MSDHSIDNVLPKGILQAIQALEAQRSTLGDAVVDPAIAALRRSAVAQSIDVGSGASAVGERAEAVGQNGMLLKGDVGRDVFGPGAARVEINLGEKGADPDALRTAYLNYLLESVSYLSLAGIDPRSASQVESLLSLSAVYTALLTLSQSKETATEPRAEMRRSERRLSALEELNSYPRMVLMGDPGSGKSTFVNFVVLCLAGEALHSPTVNLALLTTPLPPDEEGGQEAPDQAVREPKPQSWSHGALLPLRVILRDFAARGLPAAGESAAAEHLWNFIAKELESACLGDFAAHMRRELLEQGGLLLLDGLDEVPEAGRRRTQLKQAVESFASSFKKCRILVTSRTYAYQRQDWRLHYFHETELSPFSRTQIVQFIEHWYSHLSALHRLEASDAQGRAELLKHAVLGSDRLIGLAERPLLLTLMASLHAWRGGSLPEKREQLYADTVDLLLDTWESPKAVRDAQGQFTLAQPSLSEWLKVDREKVRALLNELAFNAHAGQVELAGTADVSEGALVSGLLHLSQNPEVSGNPALLVDYLSQRAGLLIPRGVGVYTFPHRTFQEYLAACYLTDHGYPDRVAELACQDPNRWREAALLAGAKAARGGAFALWALVDCLCPQAPVLEGQKTADAWGAHLAGQALIETADLEQVSLANRPKVERVRRWLVHILRENSLNAIERARAADNLAALDDPRFDPQWWYLPVEPLLGFIEIPAGEFLMGSDPKKDRDAEISELPQHRLYLPAYYLARYPVTVAQFQTFVADSSYQPKDRDNLEGPSNRPAVWVTWYDALAYCHWLGEKLKSEAQKRVRDGSQEAFWEGLASGQLLVTLPSEAEWEKAARGVDGRIYLWGDQLDPDRANYAETGLGRTSGVGCFATGASPYGGLDMSGNVWEWTRSLWGNDWQKPTYGYPYQPADGREMLDTANDIRRVVRGGSFFNDRWRVRCAVRYRNLPYDRLRYIGFRVVVSLSDPGL